MLIDTSCWACCSCCSCMQHVMAVMAGLQDRKHSWSHLVEGCCRYPARSCPLLIPTLLLLPLLHRYNCGKVCLSLLGTWAGGQGEGWLPSISTANQVGSQAQCMTLAAAFLQRSACISCLLLCHVNFGWNFGTNNTNRSRLQSRRPS